MSLTINEPVSVTMMYNHHQHKTIPIEMMWHNQHYPITEVGLHHTCHEGQVLKHIFSVTSKDIFFELSFNTSDLTWRLEKSDSN